MTTLFHLQALRETSGETQACVLGAGTTHIKRIVTFNVPNGWSNTESSFEIPGQVSEAVLLLHTLPPCMGCLAVAWAGTQSWEFG